LKDDKLPLEAKKIDSRLILSVLKVYFLIRDAYKERKQILSYRQKILPYRQKKI